MTRSIRVSLACLGLPLALALSGCGDGLGLQPNLAGTPGAASGGSTTTTTPTPAATPTATPAATPTPGPGLTCNLSSMPDCGSSCCSEGGSNDFAGVINDAQANLERTRPDIFNSNGSLRLDEEEYTALLARKITELSGVCAIGGGGNTSRSKDEVAVKRDNGRSVNVDVIIGSSHTPYIGGVYTCRPAAF